MLLTYSLTKAKCSLWDVAQFVTDLLGCTSQVHKILTTVMTGMVVDKSTDHAKPHSICFLPQCQSFGNKYLSWQLKTTTQTWKCTRCIMQTSCLYASDFPFKNFYKLINMKKQYNVYVKWHVATTGCWNRSPRVTYESHCPRDRIWCCDLSHKLKLVWIGAMHRSDKISASSLVTTCVRICDKSLWQNLNQPMRDQQY